MQELVIISGKGGTGKTSITASFAALAKRAVLADCDVDAADLHLVLEPTILRREPFSGGFRARLLSERCNGCGTCIELCRFSAITPAGGPNGRSCQIDPSACEGCGVCAWFCPQLAIEMAPAINGEWFVSDMRHGPLVHARLGVAEENSGKLVGVVREQARKVARQTGRDLIMIDGAPGIGCPVIASITGASLVLIVTEPSLSGLHDLGRVAEVARHFQIPAAVCINKWDINPTITGRIERESRERGLEVVGRVRYDRAVTGAQLARRAVVETATAGCAEDIRSIWQRVESILQAMEACKSRKGPASEPPAAGHGGLTGNTDSSRRQHDRQ